MGCEREKERGRESQRERERDRERRREKKTHTQMLRQTCNGAEISPERGRYLQGAINNTHIYTYI